MGNQLENGEHLINEEDSLEWMDIDKAIRWLKPGYMRYADDHVQMISSFTQMCVTLVFSKIQIYHHPYIVTHIVKQTWLQLNN